MQPQKFIPPNEAKTWEVEETESVPSKKTVLFLEDDLAFAEVLKEYLESFEYSVTMVDDGVKGLKRVMEVNFDVILCDLMMPNLPGDMFYLGVERTKPQLCKRFIFITGHKGNPRVAEFLKKIRGIALYKPFEMHLLMDALKLVEKASAKNS